MNRSGKPNAQQVTVSQTAHYFSTAQELHDWANASVPSHRTAVPSETRVLARFP
ncbi:hypothetical protein ACFV2H_51660 [Streptomyces sp. NPDC059629]|uniref:hypothetical protein n=1 Tax=Streptomyces sp. NPDC059629 TaxID=3346889 RepID=UPI003682CEF8